MLKSPQIDITYIGWPKSGSTWFHQFCLHSMFLNASPIKDNYLFSTLHNKLDSNLKKIYKNSENTYTLNVDINHDYIFNKQYLRNIYTHNNKMKIIIFYREPIDFILSEYNYALATGYLNCSLESYLNNYSYIKKRLNFSYYINQAFEIFGKENVKCFQLEDLKKHPELFISSLCDFFEIGEVFSKNYDYSQKINSRMTPRFKLSSKIVNCARLIRDNCGMIRIYGLLKKSYLRSILYKSDVKKNVENDYSSKIILNLNKNIINETKNLENLLNVDLSKWKKKYTRLMNL